MPDRLLLWLSPGFPVGGFAYSHGLERAVADGLVDGRAGLEGWLSALLQAGSLHNDLILLALAHRAGIAGAQPDVTALAELALALQPTAERWLETTQQGAAFRATIAAAWPAPGLAALMPEDGQAIAYPIAVALAGAAHGLPTEPLLVAYGAGFLAAQCSAAIRLGLIGQTDGQRVLAALRPGLHEAAAAAAVASIDDLGGAAFAADIASARHETQDGRLFRS